MNLPLARDTRHPDDAERDVRKYLKKRLALLGGELRKCSWFMRRHAPDELVLVPAQPGRIGRGFFAELKRPGEQPDRGQLREIAKLRAAGFTVHVIDSREAVDAALFW
jgi:hypothetical protein